MPEVNKHSHFSGQASVGPYVQLLSPCSSGAKVIGEARDPIRRQRDCIESLPGSQTKEAILLHPSLPTQFTCITNILLVVFHPVNVTTVCTSSKIINDHDKILVDKIIAVIIGQARYECRVDALCIRC